MSEEKVQESVQGNLDIKVESKPESADSGLLQEVMAKRLPLKNGMPELLNLKQVKKKGDRSNFPKMEKKMNS